MIQRDAMPHNDEAERALLGAMILDNGQCEVVSEILPPPSGSHRDSGEPLFFVQANQMVYEAICSLRERGAGIDLTTLANELRDLGQLVAVGGGAYLAGLEDNIFSLSQVPDYARIVLDKWQRRLLIRLAGEISSNAADSTVELGEIVDRSERGLLEVGGGEQRRDFVAIGPVTAAEVEAIEHPGEKSEAVPTGFRELDRMTGGGFYPGQLGVIAARPSMGKSAFSMNLAVNAALRRGIPVAFFSLEMSRRELGQRVLSTLSRVPLSLLRTPDALGHHQRLALRDAAELLSRTPLMIDDERSLTVVQVRSKARRLKAVNPNLGLVVIDYLQLVGDTGRYRGNKTNEVGEVSRALKNMAGELELPVIVLSQLSRETERRQGQAGKGSAQAGDGMPRLSDLRDSGAVEQDADLVIFIDRREDKARIKLAKQRNGPTGIFPLTYLGEYVEFVNPI